MKELKLLKYATIIFMLFIFFWMSFGGAFQGKTEIVELSDKNIEYSKQEAKLEDGAILGKFWNSQGHFVVVYDEDKKAPIIFPVDVKEWETMRVGELY